MWRAFISMWKNSVNFTGTASREAFWLGSIAEIIFMYLLLIPFALVMFLLKCIGLEIGLESEFSLAIYNIIHIGVCIFPLLSLYVRRANDVGLKTLDILLVAVSVPVVGAMIIGMYPSQSKVLYKGVAWCYRCIAIGFGFFIYGGFIGVMLLGSVEVATPFVGIGLALATISMIIGAIIVKVNQK